MLYVTDSISTVINPVNLALNQPAFQKDGDANWGTASRAVDGYIAAQYTKSSCTHTNKLPQPWWAVDLGKTMNIAFVTITNRLKVCKLAQYILFN